MSRTSRLCAFHHEYGKPELVVSLEKSEMGILAPNQVHIQMLYAAINPADINMCEGYYYTQPKLPSPLGNEGVGKIIACGDSVSKLSVGDHVIVPFKDKKHWVGAWATDVYVNEDDCIQVPSFIPLEQAAMMTINPPTAYMLLTMTEIKQNSYIIQNAANSGLGHWVIYLAKELGLKTVNLLRRTELFDPILNLGADYVFLDEKGVSKQIKDTVGKMALAINGVGGASALECMKTLAPKAAMITYGAMSKEPISIGNAALIYKDNRLLGFNRTRWSEEVPGDSVKKVYNTIFTFLQKRPLSIPIEKIYPLHEIKEALIHAQKSARSGKILLDCRSVH